jgi:3-hydroxyacyl-[acyl-carrier-protein] dehydratase
MAGSLTPAEVLEHLPQREPFRFVDRILEIDAEHVVAEYRWRPEADFYRGHFPGRPLTPGVLLVECMAQAGVAALAIFLLAGEAGCRLEDYLTVFTEANVEFRGMVEPGSRVRILAHKVYFRHRKLCAEVAMELEDGTVVCSGVLAGLAVKR